MLGSINIHSYRSEEILSLRWFVLLGGLVIFGLFVRFGSQLIAS